jgi:2-C-methyl-D-erythritol 4-phosphate cytidylyltransferase/2-C-methyl-D-erythritol 2,4-cyclodiphosphate synthase
VAKQWQALDGRSLVEHAVGRFRAALPAAEVLLVHAADDADRAAAVSGVRAVPGGAERTASVRNGLEALAPDAPDRVLIHDAARPLVPAAVIHAVHDALGASDGAAPGLPVTDALWRGEGGRVTGHADRTGLYRAQTPQGFRFPAILAAHRAHQGTAADDVAIATAAGLTVTIVPGDERNMKLTEPGDLARAQALLGPDIRTGQGLDVHAFGPGDHVWLCGVKVPHDAGLIGHSDADAGLHAACDALYGALAEGDIGVHFPPSDAQWKGAPSATFLSHAGRLVAARGYRVTSLDVTLICERPKISPHAAEMRATMAGLLGIDPGRVSVKATTSEGLGFTGRREGIAALATATLVRP